MGRGWRVGKLPRGGQGLRKESMLGRGLLVDGRLSASDIFSKAATFPGEGMNLFLLARREEPMLP